MGREGGRDRISRASMHCANCQPRTGLLLDSYWILHYDELQMYSKLLVPDLMICPTEFQ
jgi:hypothetical protein